MPYVIKKSDPPSEPVEHTKSRKGLDDLLTKDEEGVVATSTEDLSRNMHFWFNDQIPQLGEIKEGELIVEETDGKLSGAEALAVGQAAVQLGSNV